MRRTVQQIIQAREMEEGEGFIVHRPFPAPGLSQIDPFLLFDEMGPAEHAPGEAKGAPDHPHRGFETVTYILSGEMEHKDSAGNSGRLAPGDVQWMTAGFGVVHSEMPSRSFQKSGGKLHGFQIWVNLPKKNKLMKPRYQEITAKQIPIFQSADGKVRAKVIAGEVGEVRAVIDTVTPIHAIHFILEPGASFTQKLPKGFNAMAYVIEGGGRFQDEGRLLQRADLAVFGSDGDEILIEAAPDQKLSLLLLAGQPLKEPVARYGPFVMNTPEEIHQAFEDFRSGKMGQIA